MENTTRKDKENVLGVEAAYDRAWCDGDVDGILACLTRDAVLISPRGDVASGHDEIRNLLSGFLGGDARDTKHTAHILRIQFIAEDVAVVDGEARIEGREFEQSESAAYARHRFTDILVRRGEQWLISQIRACNC